MDRSEGEAVPTTSGAAAVLAGFLQLLVKNASQMTAVAAPLVARSVIDLLDATLLEAKG